jgi:hypothetical protein
MKSAFPEAVSLELEALARARGRAVRRVRPVVVATQARWPVHGCHWLTRLEALAHDGDDLAVGPLTAWRGARAWVRLARAISAQRGSNSTPTARRPSAAASTRVVPMPHSGSATSWPGAEYSATMRRASSGPSWRGGRWRRAGSGRLAGTGGWCWRTARPLGAGRRRACRGWTGRRPGSPWGGPGQRLRRGTRFSIQETRIPWASGRNLAIWSTRSNVPSRPPPGRPVPLAWAAAHWRQRRAEFERSS